MPLLIILAIIATVVAALITLGDWQGWITYVPDETGWKPGRFALSKVAAAGITGVWLFVLVVQYA